MQMLNEILAKVLQLDSLVSPASFPKVWVLFKASLEGNEPLLEGREGDEGLTGVDRHLGLVLSK